MLKRFRPDFLIALGLFLLPLILYFPVTLGGRTMLPADNLFGFEPWKSFAGQFGVTLPHNQLVSDLVLENYAWKRFIVQAIQHRELPLWNPHQFGGLPFLAAGQHSALYPFSLLFYVLPLWLAYGWFAVSQHALAGVFAYIFLRVLRLPRPAAALGAVVYELSLFMIVSSVFPMIQAGAAWLPFLLACIELIVDQRPALGGRPATLPWAALGGLAFGAMILAGHPEVIYYSALIMAAYATYRLVENLRRSLRASAEPQSGSSPPLPSKIPRAERAGRPLAPLLSLLRPALYLLMLVALGAGVGAAQLAPLADFVRYNFRTGSASFEQILGWAYPARQALAFLLPNFYGSPAHHSVFDLFAWKNVPLTANWFCIQNPGDLYCAQWDFSTHWGIKNFVEGGAYVGLLPWMLAAVGVVAWAYQAREGRRKKEEGSVRSYFPRSVPSSFPVPFFSLLALFSILFAFGTKAYALVFWLPGIDQLHSPFRWVWPLSLCVAALAGYGMTALNQGRRKEEEGRSAFSLLPAKRPFFLFVRSLAGLSLLAGIVTFTGLVFIRLFYDRFADLVQRIFLSLALADHAFPDGRAFFSYEARQIAVFALVLLASGIVLWIASRPSQQRVTPASPEGPANVMSGMPPRRSREQSERDRSHAMGWQFLAVGIIALDLLLAGWGFNSAADPKILEFTPPAIEFLKQDTGFWRFTTYAPQGKKVMLANTGWFFDLYDIRGYDSIIPKQYADYMRAIEPQSDLDYNQIGPIYNPASLDSPLLDLLNVKYVLTAVPIESPKYKLVYDGELKIYENLGVMPRAFTLPATAALYTDDPLTDLRTYDPRQYVLLDDPSTRYGRGNPAPTPTAASPEPSSPNPASVDTYGDNEVTLTAGVEEPSYVILADTYFAGWKAFARPAGTEVSEETETPIYRADGNFRAVYLPPGVWTVRFKYSPFAVKFGAFVTAISLLILLFTLGTWLWRYFYQESAIDSTARRVAKNSLVPMAMNLMNRAIDLVFAAFYLRVLGPGNAGEYALAVVIIGWFEIWTNFGLNTLLTREVSRDREHANRYLSNTTLFRLGLGAATFPLLAGGLLLWQRFGDLRGDTLLAILLLGIGMAPASVSTGLSALFYAYEKAEYPAALATITTLLRVTFGTLVLLLGFGYVGLAGITILLNMVTMTLLGILAWRQFFRPRFEFDRGLQREMARESFPLMLNHLLATLFFKVDVPLLKVLRGEKEVGWYSTAYKFVDAFNVIPSFFTLALFPVMSRQAREDRPALARYYALSVKLLVGIALPLAAVTSFISSTLVGLLAGSEFLPAGAIALSLMVWSIPIGWINSVTNYLLIALNQQRDLTRAFFLALSFNLIANLIFIPRFGYPAAAIITILSELFEAAAFYWYLRRGLGTVPWARLLWRLVASAAGMVAAMALLWPVQPILAVGAGLAVYAGGVWGLEAFDEEERTLLRGILPARIRESSRK